ncbi:hypothetical protein HDU85_003181 [Gaertneriomyces sp. JEL0708]|nr:hypothetical protein HDU85_003181 [Gaertneriomyces sp. JEL0708]
MLFRPSPPIHDRVDAGRQLSNSSRLTPYANSSAILLALPRGGVPVAFELSKRLNLPMDIMLVRKLGIPYSEETAMGAIAMGGVTYLNENMIRRLRISEESVNAVKERELNELERRNIHYRGKRPFPDLRNKTVIIVDDGIATGATLRAAILATRQLNPEKIIAAAPVGASDSVEQLSKLADEVVCCHVPEDFGAVGWFYANFPQVEDEEVLKLMGEAEKFNGSNGAKEE